MPAYHVQRSIDIDATPEKIHQAIVDYQQWPAWSPWLLAEPDANTNYNGVAGQIGHGFDWNGDVVGAGQMELLKSTPQELTMDLKFLKPFKSQADVKFDIQANPSGNSTVTWHMDSKLPFFMFFLKSMFQSMIGNDYRRGLLLLKEYVETGSTKSRSEVIGVVDAPGTAYISISTETAMDNIGQVMERDFPKLAAVLAEKNLQASGAPFAIYNKVDLKTMNCDITTAIPVSAESVPELAKLDDSTIAIGQLLGSKALKISHTGSYLHLGNGWATAMMHQRAKKLKKSKMQMPYELYISDPTDTDEKDIITEIYLPLK